MNKRNKEILSFVAVFIFLLLVALSAYGIHKNKIEAQLRKHREVSELNTLGAMDLISHVVTNTKPVPTFGTNKDRKPVVIHEIPEIPDEVVEFKFDYTNFSIDSDATQQKIKESNIPWYDLSNKNQPTNIYHGPMVEHKNTYISISGFVYTAEKLDTGVNIQEHGHGGFSTDPYINVKYSDYISGILCIRGSTEMSPSIKLTAAVTETSTTIALDSGTKLTALFNVSKTTGAPIQGTFIVIDSEIMEIVTLTGNILTVKRGGAISTIASTAPEIKPESHDNGSLVWYAFTTTAALKLARNDTKSTNETITTETAKDNNYSTGDNNPGYIINYGAILGKMVTKYEISYRKNDFADRYFFLVPETRLGLTNDQGFATLVPADTKTVETEMANGRLLDSKGKEYVRPKTILYGSNTYKPVKYTYMFEIIYHYDTDVPGAIPGMGAGSKGDAGGNNDDIAANTWFSVGIRHLPHPYIMNATMRWFGTDYSG